MQRQMQPQHLTSIYFLKTRGTPSVYIMRMISDSGGSCLICQIMAPYPWQDTAMAPVLDIFHRIEAYDKRYRLCLTVCAMHNEAHFSANAEVFFKSDNIKLFSTIQTKRLRRSTRLKLQRQYTHAHQVSTVNAFKSFCNHSLNTQHGNTLGRRVA